MVREWLLPLLLLPPIRDSYGYNMLSNVNLFFFRRTVTAKRPRKIFETLTQIPFVDKNQFLSPSRRCRRIHNVHATLFESHITASLIARPGPILVGASEIVPGAVR